MAKKVSRPTSRTRSRPGSGLNRSKAKPSTPKGTRTAKAVGKATRPKSKPIRLEKKASNTPQKAVNSATKPSSSVSKAVSVDKAPGKTPKRVSPYTAASLTAATPKTTTTRPAAFVAAEPGSTKRAESKKRASAGKGAASSTSSKAPMKAPAKAAKRTGRGTRLGRTTSSRTATGSKVAMVELESPRNLIVMIPRAYVVLSGALRERLEADKKRSHLTIRASDEVFSLIVEFLRRRQGGLKNPVPEMFSPLHHKTMVENCSDEWYAKWIDEVGANRTTLVELINVADELGLDELVELGCAKIACLVKGCRNDDIKVILDPNIVDGKYTLRDEGDA